MFLKNKINELEQYSRRNSTRLNCIPESKDEKSDDITKCVARAVDVELTHDMIDRSHRVGPKSATDSRNRAIVVKFTSHRH